MTNDIKKIGFIGLGSMGGAQARELAKLPIPLTVYDVMPKAMEPFAGTATLARSMAEVGEDADVVGICVQDDNQVLQCVDPLLPAMKPGSVLLIHSTVKPATIIAIAERAAASGITVLDSAAALTALFNADAGSGCAPPSLPTGVDFTTDSLAVFTGAGFAAQSLTVYQLGTQILLQVSAETFGAIPGSQVYIVVLPTAEAKSAEVISCTTSCSGACPG